MGPCRSGCLVTSPIPQFRRHRALGNDDPGCPVCSRPNARGRSGGHCHSDTDRAVNPSGRLRNGAPRSPDPRGRRCAAAVSMERVSKAWTASAKALVSCFPGVAAFGLPGRTLARGRRAVFGVSGTRGFSGVAVTSTLVEFVARGARAPDVNASSAGILSAALALGESSVGGMPAALAMAASSVGILSADSAVAVSPVGVVSGALAMAGALVGLTTTPAT